MSLIVYHGTNLVVKHPDCYVGRPNLDFGQGFYVTDIKEQAVNWAQRVAEIRGGVPVLNAYTLNREQLLKVARVKIFQAYDEEWLRFIVSNRQSWPVENYDYIEGGVANDRVIDSVRLYIIGLLPLETALVRLAAHTPNNQMCLRNQLLTDKYLKYDGTEFVR